MLTRPAVLAELNSGIMGDRIELNPEICNGRPVIKGTRITVDTILGYLSAGDSTADIIEGYPHLTSEDILACLDYARRVGAARSVSHAVS